MQHQLTYNIPTKKELEYEYMIFWRKVDKKVIALEDFAFTRFGRWFWVVMFTLFRRCPHYPVFGNKKWWLWKQKYTRDTTISTCSVCGYTKTTKSKSGPVFKNYSKKGRESDGEWLEKAYKKATNDTERNAIKRNLSKIVHEDKRIADMREDLIRATRDNDHQKIKEIHDYVSTHRAHQNE